MTTRGVAVLAFHAIEEGRGPICIAPSVFARQVRALHDAGCVALSMSEVERHLRDDEPFPDRAVAFTFDDGYASVHDHALPILDDVGWTGTVYPVTDELGGRNRWDAASPGIDELRLVDRRQLAELAASGWEVGGHTHTHRSLPTLDAVDVAREIDTSTAILEDLLQHAPTTFAYPFGHHDAAVRSVVAGRYGTALTIGARRARLGDSLDEVARVEAWYVQHPWALAHLGTASGDAYLLLRRIARRARPMVDRRPGPR